jgi:pilus assembly protein Flp/PilA
MDLFILKTWLEAKFDRKDEAGASLVEYGLLVALIAVVAIVAIRLLGTKVSSNFSNVGGNL